MHSNFGLKTENILTHMCTYTMQKKRIVLTTLVFILCLSLHAMYNLNVIQQFLFTSRARSEIVTEENSFNFSVLADRRDWYRAQKEETRQPVKVKPFNISLYPPICPEVAAAPTFHGASHEQAQNDGFVEWIKEWPGGSLMTLPQGMVMIRPYPMKSEAKCSAWSPVSGDVMVRAEQFGYHTEGPEWVLPPGEPWIPHLAVSGPHVFFHSWFSNNFAHHMDDHVPSIAWLREQVPEETKFLLLDTPLAQSFWRWFDIAFFNRIEWILIGQLVQVEGDLVVFDRYSYKMSHPTMSSSFHSWSDSRAPSLLPEGGLKKRRSTIVFYSRSGMGTFNGRMVEAAHEQELLRLIRIAMEKHHRQERLVIFNGYVGNGTTPMTFQQQYELMQSASVLIGPHGGGMANSLFLPAGDNCVNRPKMLEFTCGHSPNCIVQNGGGHRNSYFYQASAPWLDYHQVCYNASRSSKSTTYVQLDAFKAALDAVLR